MRYYKQRIIISVFFCLFGFLGCEAPDVAEPVIQPGPGATIGSLAEIFSVPFVDVEGYGLVAGLQGTGSSECPSHVRDYLRQFILSQLPDGGMNIDKFISSRNTAVVVVKGKMLTSGGKGSYFDVRAEAIAGSQTMSLEGGWLYKCELKQSGSFGISTRVLAHAEGAVYIDTIEPLGRNKREGFVLAGGTIRDDYTITLGLGEPDFMTVRRISDIINTRFGIDTAKAVSPELIELQVPMLYHEQHDRFVLMVSSMYLESNPAATNERINYFIDQLSKSSAKYVSEVALESIGNSSLTKLGGLLSSSDEEVRLRAGRCMLNLGSDRGLESLVQIALNSRSPYRIEALNAIGLGGNRGKATSLARKLLKDEVFEIRLGAYEQLVKMNDISINRRLVGSKLFLEQIARTGPKEIYVSRSGQPRIVLFGAPMYCSEDVFVESANGEVTINAVPGRKYVSLLRKVPKRSDVVEVKSSYEISEIIRLLCREPAVDKATKKMHAGLNVSYADTIAILKQMCDRGALPARFFAGPMAVLE
ncbi:MAG: flagellar basal body P-ring protein FlgI [Planctomycetota bacterium]|jgi:hypothetical protein